MTAAGTTRRERRAATLEEHRRARPQRRAAAHQRDRTARVAFALVAATVLAAGVYLAAGDLLGQRGAATGDAIPVRLSMAGFTPSDIRVPAGERVLLELWTTDAAAHLEGGVHTMISDELRMYEELPAADATGESRRPVAFTAPATPGTYDIYCDTCCGGKDSPSMHGKLVVEA